MSNFFVNHSITKYKSLKEIEKISFNFFQKKYFFNNYFQGACVINNIIYNEKTHLVSKFKDYLIEDDLSEFLKRYYKKDESLIRLPKYYEYYDAYSKIFPNYTALRESKYIYKNLHKKQKMIDLQQEMEESMERKKQEQEEMAKDDILKLNEPTHQRKKNQQDVIFNSDIYNSIIKQSQDLYSILFGIDKNNDEKESSIINLAEIVKLIDDNSKERVSYNNTIEVPKANYTNNKKKTTNSSLLTKQSTINSSNIHKKGRKFENYYKKSNDILIGLKKCMYEKKSVTSNSLLSNREIKNELFNSRIKSILFSKLILSKEKTINKEDNKQKRLKINVNNQNYITFLKEKLSKISSKYSTINQGINENKKTILTERETNHYRYKTLHTENSNKYKIYDLVLENYNNKNKNNENKKAKVNSRSKMLMDIGYYTRTHSKNSSVHKNKRYSTNSTNTIICETERRPSRIIKFYNKQKNKIFQVNNNNLISFNLKEIRELMKEKNMKEKVCQTERESKLNSCKMNKKISFKSNKLKNNLFKKLSSFKTTNPSIDHKTKINKNILLSQKKISGFKSIRKTLPTTPIINEKNRINRTKIFKMCQEKKLILNLESNNINKTMDKENNHDTEGKEGNNELFFTQNQAFNTLSAVKGIKIKNFSTSINFGNPNNNKNINKKKINILINKTKSNTSRNRKQKNKSDEKDLKIKNYKRIISKETSPNKFQNVISSNGTEKKKTYLIMKSDFLRNNYLPIKIQKK